MEFLITIADPRDARCHNALLRVPPGATTADIDPLLTQFVDRSVRWRINGDPVPDGVALTDAGLCDGALLDPAPDGPGPVGSSPRPALATIDVVAGPGAPRTFAVVAPESTIGRSRTADVTINDEEISRLHAKLILDGGRAVLEDIGSLNGTFVDGVKLSSPSPVGADNLVEIGLSQLAITPLAAERAPLARAPDGRLVFNRPPRIAPKVRAATVIVPGPPPQRRRAALSIAGIVAPLAIGGAMALLFHRAEYLLFTLLSPVMVIGNYFTDRSRGGKSHKSAMAEHAAAAAQAAQALSDSLDAERRRRLADHPGPDEAAQTALGPSKRLWERRRADADFMRVRVGLGNLPSTMDLKDESGAAKPPVLEGVPVTVDLAKAGVLGVAGPHERGSASARWVLLQLAALRAPDDLSVAVLAPEAAEDWEWAMWLPHTRPAPGGPVARVGLTTEAAASIAAGVAGVIDQRKEDRRAAPEEGEPLPAVVVIIDGARALRRDPSVARILAEGPRWGVYSVCVERNADALPEEGTAAVDISAAANPEASVRIEDGEPIERVAPDLIGVAACEEAARRIAPVRLERHSQASNAIPADVALLDLLELSEPPSSDIAQRWSTRPPTTRVEVGVCATGPFALDLRRDGPHALLAGTTGSGKSDLLRSLIAALAVANPPDALNFVLVDYKGASAFASCARLPHTVGMVTDLDGHLTERALASLGAEIRRRELVLKQAGAQDIDAYLELRGKDPAGSLQPMARLVIVIDEFAVLAEDLPGFIAGIVDIARRGRSLGIHMVLATQRPAGVVSQAIKANTPLRIAMRLNDAMDSADVVNSPLAARITKDRPGRGYVKVGAEALTEFQAAWIGGSSRAAASERSRPALRPVASSKLHLAAVEKDEGGGAESDDPPDDAGSDLAVLVDAVLAAAEQSGRAPQSSPWLEPLPDIVVLEDLAPDAAASARAVAYGLEDLPAQQSQAPATLDLERGSHLLVAGDAGSGRTTLLRAVAASVAAFPADDVHLYGVDCGNGGLEAVAALPHSGAVVPRSDVERVDRLLRTLHTEAERRQRLLASLGMSSAADQRSSAPQGESLPLIVVLVDRWEAYLQSFDNIDGGRLVASMIHLLREGPAAGIRAVITGDRSVLVGRIATMTDQRIVLPLNDPAGYTFAGIAARAVPEHLPKGRALRAGAGSEIQIALLDPASVGEAQSAAFARIAAQAQAAAAGVDPARRPEPVAALPNTVGIADVVAAYARAGSPAGVLIGVGGNRLDPVVVDLEHEGPAMLIAGARKSGRSNSLLVAAAGAGAAGIPVVAVDPDRSPLEGLRGGPGVLGVLGVDNDGAKELLDVRASTSGPLLVLIDDAEAAVDGPVGGAVEQLLKTARRDQTMLVAAGSASEMGAYRGALNEARKSKCGLLLRPAQPGEGDLFGVRLSRGMLGSTLPGRGALVVGGAERLVQVPDARLNAPEGVDGAGAAP